MAAPLWIAGQWEQYLRRPTSFDTSTDPPTPVWSPALTSAEQAVYADLQTMTRFGVALTLAEWQAIKPDAAGLKAYLGLASPTLAQTAAAVKALIRAMGVIIRD